MGYELGCVCKFSAGNPCFRACDGRCQQDPEAKAQVDAWLARPVRVPVDEYRAMCSVVRAARDLVEHAIAGRYGLDYEVQRWDVDTLRSGLNALDALGHEAAREDGVHVSGSVSETRARRDVDTQTSTTVGEQVRRQREARGLTGAELARRAGISKGYLHELEHGDVPGVGAHVLYRIAAALHCRMETLLGLPLLKIEGWEVWR